MTNINGIKFVRDALKITLSEAKEVYDACDRIRALADYSAEYFSKLNRHNTGGCVHLVQGVCQVTQTGCYPDGCPWKVVRE